MQCLTDETIRLNNLEIILKCNFLGHNMCYTMSVMTGHLSHTRQGTSQVKVQTSDDLHHRPTLLPPTPQHFWPLSDWFIPLQVHTL